MTSTNGMSTNEFEIVWPVKIDTNLLQRTRGRVRIDMKLLNYDVTAGSVVIFDWKVRDDSIMGYCSAVVSSMKLNYRWLDNPRWHYELIVAAKSAITTF